MRFCKVILVAFICCGAAHAQKCSHKKFEISVRQFGFMTKGDYKARITQDSIIVTSYMGSDAALGKAETFRKQLTDGEREEITQLISGNSFQSTKTIYMDPHAPEDKGNFEFKIPVAGKIKSIDIYEVKVPEIYKLVATVNKCIPVAFHIPYDDKYLNWKK